MTTMVIELPDDISDVDAKLELAFGLYRNGLVTQGQAAEIAGYGRRDFIDLMIQHGESVSNITMDELERELAQWRELESRTARPSSS